MIFALPETKGRPLEEMAVLFGDAEEIMIYSEDIHVDYTSHEVVVGPLGATSLGRVAIELAAPAVEKSERLRSVPEQERKKED
jgi:hypothetical protein